MLSGRLKWHNRRGNTQAKADVFLVLFAFVDTTN
jgi:hypothetical protein